MVLQCSKLPEELQCSGKLRLRVINKAHVARYPASRAQGTRQPRQREPAHHTSGSVITLRNVIHDHVLREDALGDEHSKEALEVKWTRTRRPGMYCTSSSAVMLAISYVVAWLARMSSDIQLHDGASAAGKIQSEQMSTNMFLALRASSGSDPPHAIDAAASFFDSDLTRPTWWSFSCTKFISAITTVAPNEVKVDSWTP